MHRYLFEMYRDDDMPILRIQPAVAEMVTLNLQPRDTEKSTNSFTNISWINVMIGYFSIYLQSLKNLRHRQIILC